MAWWDDVATALDSTPQDWINDLARRYGGDKFFPKERYLRGVNEKQRQLVDIVNQMNRNAPTLESLGEGPSFELQPVPTPQLNLQTLRGQGAPQISGGVTLPMLGTGFELSGRYQPDRYRPDYELMFGARTRY